MVDVKTQRIHVLERIELIILVTVAVEIFYGEETGQFISFGGADYLTVLGKLDRTRYPGLYDIRLRIRLGDKIICAFFETLDLGILV